MIIFYVLFRQRQKLLEAVEDINLAHAKDRAQLHQSNRDCVASIENVRHSFQVFLFSFFIFTVTLFRCVTISSMFLHD